MIEVFRFMDSSATSHPVYGIEHSGDAIDTAAMIYLGTSGNTSNTGAKIYGSGDYFAYRAKNLNLTVY